MEELKEGLWQLLDFPSSMSVADCINTLNAQNANLKVNSNNSIRRSMKDHPVRLLIT